MDTETLRRTLNLLRLSQNALARASGVDCRAIRRMASGRQAVPQEVSRLLDRMLRERD